MNPYDCRVSLQVRHPTLSAHELCKGIPLKVRIKRSRGEELHREAHQGDQSHADASYCVFELGPPTGAGLVEAFNLWLDQLAPAAEFISSLRSSGGEVRLYLAWFSDKNSGEVFDWRLFSRLAELRVDLALDFYPRLPPQPAPWKGV